MGAGGRCTEATTGGRILTVLNAFLLENQLLEGPARLLCGTNKDLLFSSLAIIA
jgi:hypothetical protein